MVRRFHRSIYDELDELRASMDYLYQVAFEPVDAPPALPEDTPGIVCMYVHNVNAEVTEHDDEVTVTVDAFVGTGNLKITASLVNEKSLRITCELEEERIDDGGGICLCERRSVSLHHAIPLPAGVTDQGAGMSLKNGVLDIRLKKAHPVQNANQ